MQDLKILTGTVLLPRHVAAVGRVRAMTDAYLAEYGDVLASPDDFTLSEMIADIVTALYAREADVSAILARAHWEGRRIYRG
jgi:hypothetical protein